MQKWTVRGVDPDVIDMLHDVAGNSGMTIGETLNEAVTFWYDALPDGDDPGAEDIDVAEFTGTALTRPGRFWMPG
jgi:hypothetical protein